MAKRPRARPRRDNDCNDDVVEGAGTAALVEATRRIVLMARMISTQSLSLVWRAVEGWHTLERPVKMPSAALAVEFAKVVLAMGR